MQIDSAPSDGSVPIKQEDASHSSWQNFPNGLRVLVVDDDPLCLKVIEQMLRRCNYEVHTCSNGAAALEQLRDKSHGFDLVLSDVYMPDMDGFKLLEAIGLELDLPVIMMSSNGEHATVLRGVTHGAVDFLIKPVRIEELRNIWQHVIRRTGRHAASSQMQSSGEMDHDDLPNEAETCRKRKDAGRESASEREEESSASKKPRVVWSAEMHLQFVHAVNQLGIDKAVPKKILEIMKVEGLTRENVASHLQKYRLYLKRVQGVSGGHQHGAKGGKPAAAAAAGLGSSPPLQQQQQHHNGVQLADMGLVAAPGMVPVQPPGATPFAAAAGTAVPLPGPGVAAPAVPTQVLPPVMLQQQGSSMLPAAVGVPPATSQAPAAAAAMPAGMPPMGGMLPAGMMPGVMAGMQPGVAAMQMNALMGMGMAGLGLPGLAMPPPGAGPMLGGLGPMGLPAMGLGGLPGMPGLPPPNMPGMMGMPQVPGMPLGQGMMNPADPNAIMMAFQAMLQAGGRPPPATATASSMGTASGSTGTPSMAAVGLPAASTIPSMPSMSNLPGAAAPVGLGDAGGMGMQPLASTSATLPAVGGSLAGGSGGGAMDGLGSPLGADKLLPDVMDFSTMFEDGFNGPGAPGSAALGAGDIGGGVDEFLDMLLQG